MYPALHPIKPNDNRPKPTFAVVDIEATRWVNFLIIGYYGKEYETIKDGKRFVEQIYKGDKLEMFQDMGEWAEWMFEDEQVHDTVFAHFGGKYDFQFILKEYFARKDRFYIDGMIPRGSGLLCVSVSLVERVDYPPDEKQFIRKNSDGTYLMKKRTITFKDSSALLPFSLESLTKNFGVEHIKGEIDFDKMTKVTEEVKTYLKHDLIGLHEVLEKFYEWPLVEQAGFATTMASQAVRVWQTYLTKSIPSLTDEIDSFVRDSYFGGRTEIFKPFFMRGYGAPSIKTFDVNSLYPFCMLSEFPIYFKHKTKRIKEGEMGFYDVTVKVPDMYVPPLGTVYDPQRWCRLIFPTGIFRGKWSSIELEYAQTLGVKILKCHGGVVFGSGGHIFEDYITDLYGIRQKAEKNSVDNVLSKLLMNSTYGRTGLNREREAVEFDYGQPGVSVHWDLAPESKEVARLVTSDITLDSSFVNVAIAAWVTSLARIHMHKLYMKAPSDLYYTDTDSLFTTHDYQSNEDDLGALKFEYDADASCFLLPKTYIVKAVKDLFDEIDTRTGKKLKSKTNKKIVMKGFDKRKIQHFTLEDFQESLSGEMGILKATNPEKFATFKTALNDGKFLKLLAESPREIRSRYDKRRIYKRRFAHVWDTEPLHIKDGEIINRI